MVSSRLAALAGSLPLLLISLTPVLAGSETKSPPLSVNGQDMSDMEHIVVFMQENRAFDHYCTFEL